MNPLVEFFHKIELELQDHRNSIQFFLNLIFLKGICDNNAVIIKQDPKKKAPALYLKFSQLIECISNSDNYQLVYSQKNYQIIGDLCFFAFFNQIFIILFSKKKKSSLFLKIDDNSHAEVIFPKFYITKSDFKYNCSIDCNHDDLTKILHNFNEINFNQEFLNGLGLIMEKIIYTSIKDKKSKGAYYTPEILVELTISRVIFYSVWSFYLQISQPNSENSEIFSGTDYSPERCLKKISTHFKKLKKNHKIKSENNQKVLQLDAIINNILIHIQNLNICDPACGAGNFLIKTAQIQSKWQQAFHLALKQRDNSESLLTGKCILYGFDIEILAIKTTIIRLLLFKILQISQKYKKDNLDFVDDGKIEKYSNSISKNIQKLDFLIEDSLKFPFKFDIFIGNPPYLNIIENEPLRKQLEHNYPEIYHGKLDLCYYFINKCFILGKPLSFTGFVLKRYFLKSPTAQKLRMFIKQNYIVNEIIDINSQNMFRGAKIETLVLILSTKLCNLSKSSKISVLNTDNTQISIIEPSMVSESKINLNNMLNRWIINQKSKNILKNPNKKTLFDFSLKDYKEMLNSKDINPKDEKVKFFKLVKGIQTGKDSVFIVEDGKLSNSNSKKLKKIIKGLHILPYKLVKSNKRIIISHQYSPIIGIQNNNRPKFPIIEQYLLENKGNLVNRSRTDDKTWSFWRKGDERNTVDFEGPKIVWPYRGKKFFAAIDWKGHYHSQDVVLLTINVNPLKKRLKKKEFEEYVSKWQNFGIYFYLGLLNSTSFKNRLFVFAKEFAKDVKDFQPNNFHHMRMPLYNLSDKNHEAIVNTAQKLESLHAIFEDKATKKKISSAENYLNSMVKTIFTEKKEDLQTNLNKN
jgi:adenine-specific DNA-methyltransferase